MVPIKYTPEEYTESSAKALEDIAERARAALKKENYLDVQFGSVVYSCTVKFLETLAQYLAENPEDAIDISSLLKFSVENREDKKAEKAGNIVPVVEVGERFKLACKNDNSTEEDEA